MFRVPVHNQILEVLRCLDADLLSDCQIYFGGGTQIVMSHGEYRLSRDIDFLCPYGTGYTQLRRALFDRGYEALFRRDDINLPRAFQADQYGIRFPVEVAGTIIKFEIVAEGRIDFGQPQQLDWCPVRCLGQVDQVAEKLLANSDRWLDASVCSRDLIDLAMLRRVQVARLSEEAFEKAEAAYPVRRPLVEAIRQFQTLTEHRTRCFKLLEVSEPALVIDGIDALANDLGLGQTMRTTGELR